MESSAGIARLEPTRGTYLARTGWRDMLVLGLFSVAAAMACAVIVAEGSVAVRGIVAISAFALLMSLIERDSVSGLLATFVFVFALATARRLLTPVAGWSSSDPLLLVGPAIAATLFVRRFVVGRRTLAPELLSGLVLALLAFALLQAFNPRNGSPVTGVVGLLFLGVPLLWFFVGREYLAGDGVPIRLLWMVVVLGSLGGAYGLVQGLAGLPGWDAAWAASVNYNALQMSDGSVSIFGSFASSGEFALFMAVSVVVAVALALCGRTQALVSLAITGPALLLSSSRTAVVLAFFAVVTLLVLRSVPARAVPVALAACVLIGFAVAPVAGSLLVGAAAGTSNQRISYQLGGIGDPTGGDRSTVKVHWQLFRNGIVRGATDPFGAGTGATNRASRLAADGNERGGSTEVDVSNVFISFGLLGGLVFLAIIAVAFRDAARNFVASRDPFSYAALGTMIVTLGSWLSGGYYAVSTLVWIMLGVTAARRAAAAAPSLRHRA